MYCVHMYICVYVYTYVCMCMQVYFMSVCVHMCVHVGVCHGVLVGVSDQFCEVRFSLVTFMQVPGVTLRSPGLCSSARAVTHRAVP